MKILERDSECEKACNEKKCEEEVGGFGRVYIGRRSRFLLEDRVFTRIDDLRFLGSNLILHPIYG